MKSSPSPTFGPMAKRWWNEHKLYLGAVLVISQLGDTSPTRRTFRFCWSCTIGRDERSCRAVNDTHVCAWACSYGETVLTHRKWSRLCCRLCVEEKLCASTSLAPTTRNFVAPPSIYSVHFQHRRVSYNSVGNEFRFRSSGILFVVKTCK